MISSGSPVRFNVPSVTSVWSLALVSAFECLLHETSFTSEFCSCCAVSSVLQRTWHHPTQLQLSFTQLKLLEGFKVWRQNLDSHNKKPISLFSLIPFTGSFKTTAGCKKEEAGNTWETNWDTEGKVLFRYVCQLSATWLWYKSQTVQVWASWIFT